MSKSRSKFHSDATSGVMGTLSETLPDERPITALQIVENSGKCPQGFWPILKTYDEDSDADLWRQPILFGKRTCRYLCISKSEGISGRTVSALRVISSSDPPPAGYSGLPVTSDSKARGWRKRQLCYLLSPRSTQEGPLTDIILCSKLKRAPEGFQYAGEINGIVVCYKVSGGVSPTTSPLHQTPLSPLSPLVTASSPPNRIPLITPPDVASPTDVNYENVLLNGGDFSKRLPPERPPKTSAIVAELNRLNLQDNSKPPSSTRPSRPAPPAPRKGLAPLPPSHTSTLGGWNPVEGVPFVLNTRLGGIPVSELQYPVIKRKSIFQLDQEYSYHFIVERQT